MCTRSREKRSECGAGILLSSGNTEKMDLVTEVKDTDSDEWTRVSVTITIASQTEVTTAFFLDNMQGWAYFSCFQLEKSAAANKFNMLRNAFFEEAFNATGENGWKLSQGESADQIVTDSVKGKCARLRGNLSKNKNLMQTVKVSGKEGDVFVFGCSVKADAIPGRIFRVRAVVHFTDKTTTETIVNCNPYVTEWQFVNGVILTRKDGSTTNKTYESIQIYLEYQKQQNDAFFTGLQLIRDDAESYVYDANGNIVSAKTAAEQNAFTCNKTDLLSKMVKVTGSSFEYEYDGKKNDVIFSCRLFFLYHLGIPVLHPGNSLACAVVTGYLSNYKKQYQQAISQFTHNTLNNYYPYQTLNKNNVFFDEPYGRTFRTTFYAGSNENRTMRYF